MPHTTQPEIGLGTMILRRCALSPALPALSFEGATLDYAGFERRIRLMAGALRRAGVNRGDRVAFLGANHPVFLETMYAAAVIGAIFLPLNFRLTGPELAFILNDAGVHTLLVDDLRIPVTDGIREMLHCRNFVAVESPSPGWIEERDFVADAVPVAEPESVGAQDTALIRYTSGTTGRPKGAVLTHGNLFWNNEKRGEAVTAVVRLKSGAALTLPELREFATARLARYKLPLKLHFLDEMPRNPAGKVLKYQFREQLRSP